MRKTPQETADLVTFTEKIFNGKLFFVQYRSNPNVASISPYCQTQGRILKNLESNLIKKVIET